jgi:hypothetical protein
VRLHPLAAIALALAALPARAHHGSASVSAIGIEGPGAAIDTTSPLPLGRGTVLAYARTEYVPFQQLEGFEEQKQYSSFNTLALGFGIRPWLSAFVFQPYSWKSQDVLGTNSGLGDTNLMLSASFKWDEGPRLVPEKESLDELADWHFGVWVAATLPVGPTDHRDDLGDYWAPDMQTGFAGTSPALGLVVLKQLSADLTLLGELNYQHFFEQSYEKAGYRYQFGGETRLNGALVWRAWASGRSRVDLAAELSGLNLKRDRSDADAGNMEALQASGGTILYGQAGARATFGSLSIGMGLKRAVAKRLNEEDQQQGSEGLEVVRASLSVSWSTRL